MSRVHPASPLILFSIREYLLYSLFEATLCYCYQSDLWNTSPRPKDNWIHLDTWHDSQWAPGSSFCLCLSPGGLADQLHSPLLLMNWWMAGVPASQANTGHLDLSGRRSKVLLLLLRMTLFTLRVCWPRTWLSDLGDGGSSRFSWDSTAGKWEGPSKS